MLGLCLLKWRWRQIISNSRWRPVIANEACHLTESDAVPEIKPSSCTLDKHHYLHWGGNLVKKGNSRRNINIHLQTKTNILE